MKRIMRLLLLSWMLLCLWTQPAFAEPASEALSAADSTTAHLFEIHCAGCHPNGGNIIRRGKTLKQKALQRNKVDSVETISTLIANGKGIMSAFRDRISEAEITALAQYVLDQAEHNWQ
ncbi:MAG TPA: c-type cytochrome [Leptolyngbyaceae cyanobacterium]